MFFLKDDSVLEMINEGLRGLWANLCEFIYPKIAEMYSVFMDLSKLIYSDDLSAIYNKISLFLGIFMIFRLSFWLIEALMNPDILGDKAKAPGEMIKKVFLVVVLLGITPSIFKYAYKLQYEVVNSNVIGNIISDNKTVKPETKEFGKILSADLFSIFYRPNYDEAGNILSAENLDCSIYTGTSDNNYEGYYYTILKNSGDLKYLSENRCLREKVEVEFTDTKEKVDAFVVDFDGLYATAVGIFVFWMILMYCISLGTRYVQLIFLQVIAPIPIMGYLSTDKDNMFSKWVKQCTTTYLDVFIRIIIINFTVWLISMVLSGNSAIPSDLKKGGMITLFLVLGLLTFAKKAPELIQELLPKSVTKASGDFGLSWKKRTDAMLGGKYLYSMPKKAIGFAAATGFDVLRRGIVRGVNTAKYNAREDEKAVKAYNKRLEDERAEYERIKNDNKLDPNKKKQMLDEQRQKIERLEKGGLSRFRRQLRRENRDYLYRLQDSSLSAAERANLMEKITENVNSGIGQRSQVATLATSVLGGALNAGNAALHGNKISDIIKKTSQATTKSINAEQKWYANNDYTTKNVVKRTISEVQRALGLETEGQATQYIIDSLDAEIKAEEEKISKMKETQKVYSGVVTGVDAIESKGEKDLQKNKTIKLGDGTTAGTEEVLSSDVDLLENEQERVRAVSQQIEPEEGIKALSSSPNALKIIESLVDNTCAKTKQKPEKKAEIMSKVQSANNVSSAFDVALMETGHIIKKFRADRGKLQAAAGLAYYLDETAGVEEKNRRGYKSPDVSDKASEIFRILSSPSNRADCSFDVDISKITGKADDKIPAYLIETKMRELISGKMTIDELEKLRDYDDLLKDVFKVVTRNKSSEVDNATEGVQDRKHEKQAFSVYSETTAAIEADKFNGGK